MAGTIASASSISWTTPRSLLDLVRQVTPEIDLDPCSNPNSIVNAKHSFTLPVDSLEQDWHKYESFFMNSPFGVSYLSADKTTCLSAKEFKALKEESPSLASTFKKQTLKMWVAKAVETYEKWEHVSEITELPNNCEGYVLLPCAMSESHFHELLFPKASAICYFRGRIAYDNDSGKKSSPSMGSCLLYFGHRPRKFKRTFEAAGHHVDLL